MGKHPDTAHRCYFCIKTEYLSVVILILFLSYPSTGWCSTRTKRDICRGTAHGEVHDPYCILCPVGFLLLLGHCGARHLLTMIVS
jgi:hypothetical protein